MIQTLECDLKWLYSAIMVGELKDNFSLISPWTLGATIKALEELDKSDENRILSDEEYKKLKRVNHMRNEIVHHVFTKFLYTDKKYESDEYIEVDKEVTKFYESLLTFSVEIEKKRFLIFKKYGRM